jgi:MoxR-like ATPase
MDDATAEIARFRTDYLAVREQVLRVIVGHEDVVDGVLTCLFCDGHALLEGVPGLGKTLLIRTLARALQLTFSRVQFTPDLMPADISGTTVVMESEQGSTAPSRQFVFQPGPVFAQIVLADEINRATPKTQSAMLEAMQERSVTVGGVTHALPKPFLVMATQNPIEQEGTYPLPEAQLDRFFFKLLVSFGGRSELAEILNRTTSGRSEDVLPVLTAEQITAHQRLVQRGVIAPPVQDYAVRVVLATHPRGRAGSGTLQESFSTPLVDRYVRLGASPRAAQAIVLAAKCRALLDGRAAASIHDVQQMARPALRHRLILNFEAQAEGVSADALIENILATLPARSDT